MTQNQLQQNLKSLAQSIGLSDDIHIHVLLNAENEPTGIVQICSKTEWVHVSIESINTILNLPNVQTDANGFMILAKQHSVYLRSN
jgi:hypothetical protein